MKFSRASLAAFLAMVMFGGAPIYAQSTSGGAGASVGTSTAGTGSVANGGVAGGVSASGTGIGTGVGSGIPGSVTGNGGVGVTGAAAVPGANGVGGVGASGGSGAGASANSSRGVTGANNPAGFTGTPLGRGTSIAGSNVAGQQGFSQNGTNFNNQGFATGNVNGFGTVRGGFGDRSTNSQNANSQGQFDRYNQGQNGFGSATNGFANDDSPQFEPGEFGSTAREFNGRSPFSNDFRMGNPGSSADTDGQGGGGDVSIANSAASGTQSGNSGFDDNSSSSQSGFDDSTTEDPWGADGHDDVVPYSNGFGGGANGTTGGFGAANQQGVAATATGQSRFSRGGNFANGQEAATQQTPSQAAVTRAAQRRNQVLQQAATRGSAATPNSRAAGASRPNVPAAQSNANGTGTQGQVNPFQNFDMPSPPGNQFQPRTTYGYERL